MLRYRAASISNITRNLFYTTKLNTAMSRSIKSSIELNEREKKIKQVLVNFCDYYNQHQPKEKKLELRITGGWVRDKLLGNESNDIDIAINHLTGEEFTNQLYEYLSVKYPSLHLKSVHTIKKNPEKSKHLETCTTKLFDLDIDFVNLRSEIYSNDSRVPVIEFGTAEEDARRRDATLNSLFYNINFDKIEDFTGKGMIDLKNGILRTPLPPLKTFLDDPLRVLRLIRFACRFNFLIDESTLGAMKDPEIKKALTTKISRERVGIEIDKMLMSTNPEYGLQLINYIGLFQSIFTFGDLEGKIKELNQDQTFIQLEEVYSKLPQQTNKATHIFSIYKKLLNGPLLEIVQHFSKDHQRLFWLSIALAPFKTLGVSIPKETHVTEVLLREGLKYSKKDIEIVSTLVKQYELSLNDVKLFLNEPEKIKRSTLGIYLRNFKNFSDLNLLFACFNDILQSIEFESSIEEPNPENNNVDIETFQEVITSKIQQYNNLIERIRELGLENVYSLKPVVDGKLLSKELKIKPGPWMGNVTPEILIWQLDNPDKSAGECLEYIRLIIGNYI